jgi:hypothetical protein
MISFPALAFCQFEDEELMIKIGESLFPGQIDRWPDENGLRIWVDGDPSKPEWSAKEARAVFQTVLGVLPVWRPEAGELQEERRGGLGLGSIRDRAGNQWINIGPVIEYVSRLSELDALIDAASRAVPTSERLRNALWLFGRTHLDAADCFMVYEYAVMELGGGQRLMTALSLPGGWIKEFEDSVHNLAPQAGGRHARQKRIPPLTLDQVQGRTADLLRRWIEYHAEEAG